jgi:transposase
MGYLQSVRNDFIRLRLQGETIESIHTDHYPLFSLKTLKRWEIRTNTTGNLVAKKSPGRPQKIQGRDERRFLRAAKRNKDMCIKRIAQEADINACHETLVKVLKRNNLQSLPMLKKPKLTEDHIRKRYNWAYSMRHQTLSDWKTWTFSDECSFSLDCSEGVRRVVINPKDRHNADNCIGRKQLGVGN